MFDPNASELTRPAQSLARQGAEVPAFINRYRSFFILLGVITAQLLLLSFQITRNPNMRLIRYWAVTAFDPLERSLRGLVDASTNTYTTYRHLWRAQEENQELHIRLVAAQAQIQRLTQQAAESERLRNLLQFKNQLPIQTVAAEVIASSPGESSNAIFIDKGSDAGLAADLAVVTPEGVVGKILTIFPHSAQVLLLTDTSSGVGVTLARTRVQGILKGQSGGLCDVHYVMNEEPIAAGEAVVTSGLDQIFPKGLPVGTVAKAGDGNIYKNIVVKPAVDLNRLDMVLVVLKPASIQQQALNLPVRQ